MFFRLFSIEITRLFRRVLPWLFLATSGLFAFLGVESFYTLNREALLSGEMKIPGLSFEMANSLDQDLLVALPLLVILASIQAGSDYSQRTNQHWLMRAPRHTGLLAKLAGLAGFTFLMHVLVLTVSAGTGWYYKTFSYNAFTLANVNPLATVAAPFYMTLAALPYLALILLITVAVRSSFAGALAGLALTQFVDLLLTSFLYGRPWMMWHPHNLGLSLTYLLNSIGNRVVAIPEYLAQPLPAVIGLIGYTTLLMAAASWLYHRQDLGG